MKIGELEKKRFFKIKGTQGKEKLTLSETEWLSQWTN